MRYADVTPASLGLISDSWQAIELHDGNESKIEELTSWGPLDRVLATYIARVRLVRNRKGVHYVLVEGKPDMRFTSFEAAAMCYMFERRGDNPSALDENMQWLHKAAGLTYS
jgi:hypothetical protein